MNLKLACADFAFPLLPHDQALDLIAMLGFDGVDIGLFERRSHLWPSQEFRGATKAGTRLQRKLANRGLRCADVFLQSDTSFVTYAINHPEPSRRKRARSDFLRLLEYAAAAGAKHVTSLPGVYFDTEPAIVSWQRCCEELAWRVQHARQHRLIFGIEAHVGSIVPKPKAALRLVREVPGLTLTLDYTHFTRSGLPDRAVEPLVAHASHFHARGACKGRLQAPFQHNTIDYARVLRSMKKTDYRGHVGVEYVWIDWEHCNEVDNLSETIQLRDFIRSAMKKIGRT